MGARQLAAVISAAAAAIWPTLACALANLTSSPYERALAAAWCGGAPHGPPELMGHCAACWAGSTLLAATGALALGAPGARVAATAQYSRRR